MKEYIEANRRRWEESAGIHRSSTTGFYPVAAFLAGADILLPIESAEVGDIAGKKLLHLQCHFGLDTLSLARRGATVTGLDFSSEAIKTAAELSAQTCVPGRFIEGEVSNALELIYDRFDVVYVTWGSINWLPDIRCWAQIVADFIAPGGYLYLLEGHPVVLAMDQSDDGRLIPAFDYFQGAEPLVFDSVSYTQIHLV